MDTECLGSQFPATRDWIFLDHVSIALLSVGAVVGKEEEFVRSEMEGVRTLHCTTNIMNVTACRQ